MLGLKLNHVSKGATGDKKTIQKTMTKFTKNVLQYFLLISWIKLPQIRDKCIQILYTISTLMV